MCTETANHEKLEQVLEELRKPFHPSAITWKPGALAKSGPEGSRKAMALAYGDLRAYQNRLDEVCGANWSVSYTPWGERIVCNLTIFGVTRSSTGEPDSDSDRAEISGTVAEAQAFKRACAMFGLGRYLYNLPTVWAEYDAQKRQFTEPAKAKLLGVLMQQYRRAVEPKDEVAELFHERQENTTNEHSSPARSQDGEQPSARSHDPVPGVPGPQGVPEYREPRVPREQDNVAQIDETELAAMRTQLDELGQDLYGEQWEQVCSRNVKRVSGGKARQSSELNADQIQKLINGMLKLKSQRVVA